VAGHLGVNVPRLLAVSAFLHGPINCWSNGQQCRKQARKNVLLLLVLDGFFLHLILLFASPYLLFLLLLLLSPPPVLPF